MMRAPLPRLAAIGAATLMLCACGHSPPTRFFTLDAVAPPAAPLAGYAGPPVRVDAVHVPSALDRTELVRELAADELKVDDFDHWGAPLGQLMQRALTQDLLARLPAGAVVFPDAAKPAGGLGVGVDVLAVSEAGGQTTMDVSWTLAAPPPPPPPHAGGTGGMSALSAPARPVTRTRVVRLSTPGSGGDASAHASALSQLTAQLADAIAADLARTGG